ncbi:MAG: 50S ribosomal protein L10 [Candidatus Pacearchaeota archaeon]
MKTTIVKKQVEKREVPKYKIKLVENLAKLINENNTIMIASIKGLPTANFQKIKKSLKVNVNIQVPKKRIILRAIDLSKKEGISELKKEVREDQALLFSQLDAFELSEMLGKSRSPVKAKAGQKSEKDIEIEAGPTDLPAGPAVSELGGIGLTVQIKEGKIEILKPKIIVKKEQIISESVASVMSKLNIMPFSVGFVPLIAYDSKNKEIFKELEIDKEAAICELKIIFAKLRAFAINLGYICNDTIGMMISKAGAEERIISNLLNVNSNSEE